MDCPRCGLSLRKMEYEGEEVSFCGTCWGFWLKRAQLDNIVNNVQYKFSEYEKDAVLRTFTRDGDADRQGSEREVIKCPECSQTLAKKKYDPGCPVIIDECAEHGVWLDTGEIKDLQVFIERNLQRG
ncbi:MAG: zf-TFIIB domain-containing protein [Planctomycetota bacterium]